MTYYKYIADAVNALRNTKGLTINVRSISENSIDKFIYLVCDTDNGLVGNVDPYMVFKVKIPFDDLSSWLRR